MEEIKMVVVDNTVLSNFALIDSLDMLQQVSNVELYTTQYVMDEFSRGVEIGRLPQSDLGWILLCYFETPKEERLFARINLYLGSGEASCLSVAISRGYKLLTDDWDAREWGLREGVSISGSVGVLADLVRSGSISIKEGNELLLRLIKKGYYSPVTQLDELIREE